MFGLFKRKKKELDPVVQHVCELLEEPGWKLSGDTGIRKGDIGVGWCGDNVFVTCYKPDSASLPYGLSIKERLQFREFEKQEREEYRAIMQAALRVHGPLAEQAKAEEEARILRAFGLKEGEG